MRRLLKLCIVAIFLCDVGYSMEQKNNDETNSEERHVYLLPDRFEELGVDHIAQANHYIYFSIKHNLYFCETGLLKHGYVPTLVTKSFTGASKMITGHAYGSLYYIKDGKIYYYNYVAYTFNPEEIISNDGPIDEIAIKERNIVFSVKNQLYVYQKDAKVRKHLWQARKTITNLTSLHGSYLFFSAGRKHYYVNIHDEVHSTCMIDQEIDHVAGGQGICFSIKDWIATASPDYIKSYGHASAHISHVCTTGEFAIGRGLYHYNADKEKFELKTYASDSIQYLSSRLSHFVFADKTFIYFASKDKNIKYLIGRKPNVVVIGVISELEDNFSEIMAERIFLMKKIVNENSPENFPKEIVEFLVQLLFMHEIDGQSVREMY